MAIRSLSVYLLKPVITSPSHAVRQDLGLKQRILSIGNQPDYYLYAKPTRTKWPSWATFFEPYVEAKFFGRTTSPSAVLLVPVAGRWMAVTFGHGRNLLVAESWEESFGLLVALNSIEEGQIRSIDKKAFDAFALQTREQASRDAATSDFGLDIERDLLKAVTGTPENSALGKRLSGMAALKAHVEVKIDSLCPLLDLYRQKSLEERYKENFPWVDQLAEVKDSKLKDRLNGLLLGGFGYRLALAKIEVDPVRAALKRYS